MSQLFEPFQIGPLALANRIIIAPMCQYSASEGSAVDWHLIHLGHLALSGAGLLIVEATAVSAEGRITAGDLGLYSDDNEAALARVLAAVRANSPIKIGMQLAHAGRKASSRAPWEGGAQVPLGEPGLVAGGRAVGRAAFARRAGADRPRRHRAWRRSAPTSPAPRRAPPGSASTASRFTPRTATCCTSSCRRSPTSAATNTAAASKTGCAFRSRSSTSSVPPSRPASPVWARISATDWVPGGWDIDGTVALSQALKARGCAAIHVSSGGVSPQQKIALGPGYQVPFAQRVKAEVGLPTIAVGLITEPEQAETIIASGEADAVSLARAMLYDPRWPWHAAAEARRPRRRAAPVLALAAASIQRPVRERSVRRALSGRRAPMP